MRKLLICSPSHNVRGGVESIINEMCRELPARGWEAVLALGQGGRFNMVDAYRKTYPDLPIVAVDGTRGTRQARIEALTRTIEEVRPEVVLSARIFDAYHALALLKQHGHAPRLAIGIRAYEPQYFYDARMYKDHIDLCVTSGRLIAQAAVFWSGLSEDRVISIPGGVKLPEEPPQPRRPGKVARLGYVGRLEQWQKRVFDFVPFLEGLDRQGIEYTLDIVGSGPAEQELAAKIDKWIKNGRARMHGWQNLDRLYGYFFPRMDIFVHFAAFEGVTIAPREAMVHGVVPVISRFTGLQPEGQFVDGENVLTFPVGDTDAAIRQIHALLVEPGLMERLSARAMRSQQGIYSRAGAMDGWADAFDRCLAGPPAVGSVPRLDLASTGRMARLGISPWLAQRIRDVLGKRPVHENAGSEWPTGSGQVTPAASEEIWNFARKYEQEMAM